MATPPTGEPEGAPSKWNPDFVEQAYKLCLLGFTTKELAKFFEVSESTVKNWMNEYPEFLASIKKGKEMADADIADSLYQRAKGYEHPDVDIKVIKGKIVKTELVKHYPPDTAAAMIWLKNRQRKKWRDKQEVEVTDANPHGKLSDKDLDERIREHLERRRRADATA